MVCYFELASQHKGCYLTWFHLNQPQLLFSYLLPLLRDQMLLLPHCRLDKLMLYIRQNLASSLSQEQLVVVIAYLHVLLTSFCVRHSQIKQEQKVLQVRSFLTLFSCYIPFNFRVSKNGESIASLFYFLGCFLSNSIKFVMHITFLTRDLDVKLTALSFYPIAFPPFSR